VRLSKSVRSFLNVTTDKVYDNKEQAEGYVETDFLDGYDPYSNSKSCSELVTHSYKKSFLTDLPVSCARAGNVIGGGDFAKDRIVPDCVRAAISKNSVIIRNPNSIRPFQHVLEPLFIYLDIIMRQEKDRGKYEGYFNVGPDDSDCVNAKTLVESFKRAWGDGFEFKIQSDCLDFFSISTKSTKAFAFASAYSLKPNRLACKYSSSPMKQQIGFEPSARCRNELGFSFAG